MPGRREGVIKTTSRPHPRPCRHQRPPRASLLVLSAGIAYFGIAAVRDASCRQPRGIVVEPIFRADMLGLGSGRVWRKMPLRFSSMSRGGLALGCRVGRRHLSLRRFRIRS